eukprot:GFYU01015626.1.p1 GENE.GFYU01015626.1~~GFYU01015626.1.p1  ORF type:complete len:121 (+),score=10.15 GFYU01015626.1:97-459(+)
MILKSVLAYCTCSPLEDKSRWRRKYTSLGQMRGPPGDVRAVMLVMSVLCWSSSSTSVVDLHSLAGRSEYVQLASLRVFGSRFGDRNKLSRPPWLHVEPGQSDSLTLSHSVSHFVSQSSED